MTVAVPAAGNSCPVSTDRTLTCNPFAVQVAAALSVAMRCAPAAPPRAGAASAIVWYRFGPTCIASCVTAQLARASATARADVACETPSQATISTRARVSLLCPQAAGTWAPACARKDNGKAVSGAMAGWFLSRQPRKGLAARAARHPTRAANRPTKRRGAPIPVIPTCLTYVRFRIAQLFAGYSRHEGLTPHGP